MYNIGDELIIWRVVMSHLIQGNQQNQLSRSLSSVPVEETNTSVVAPSLERRELVPLQQILDMSNAEIFKKGVPLDSLRAWRDRFYVALEDEQSILLKLDREAAWAYDPAFFKTSGRRVEMGFDERGEFFLKQSTHRDHFLTTFHHMMHPKFWRDASRHITVLSFLYRLHKSVEFPANDPTEKVFVKLMDCLADRI